MTALAHFSGEVRRQVDACLDQCLSTRTPATAGLFDAMRYAVLNGGKRLRPILVFAAADACGQRSPLSLACAAAVELIHAYSLVHDDLPAMDDDDLRRGEPTLHIAFDEATAILAGDALQTAAFELLIDAAARAPSQGLDCLRELALGAGAQGMAGGQYIDLQAEGFRLGLTELQSMHQLKTGALIRASVRMGALAAGLDRNDPLFSQLSEYGHSLGLAFQIKDDLLDATGSTEVIGKRSGADANLAKPNFVSLLGVEGAQSELDSASRQALQIATALGNPGARLVDLVHFVANRAL